MKKKALLRRGLVLLMSASLLFTQPAIALAADTAPAQESGEEIILDEDSPSSESGEEVSEELSEDESKEDADTSEEQSEDLSEDESETTEDESEEETETTEEGTEEETETSEEGTEEESEATEEDTEEESELTEEEVASLFPGLDAGIALTAEAYESKDQLSDHSNEWASMIDGVSYVTNQILYQAETKELADEYAKAYNATVVDYFYPFAVAELNADDTYKEATVMDALEASLLFEDTLPAVWPNFIYQLEDYDGESEIEYTYSDPYADPYKTGGSSTRQWQHNAVGSQIAWANGYAGQGVKVGVIDTGFNNHTELTANRIDVGLGVADDVGHGTHVAGTIAEKGNGTGGCGIAPEVTIYTVKVNKGTSIYTSYAIQGLQKLQAAGVSIINISSGGYYYDANYETALKKMYEAGIAVFASAGNESNTSCHYPSDYKTVISIGALNEGLGRAYFSNHSSRVRYYAPGVNILSLDMDGSSYVTMSGTSMASPVAAGEAAVILSSGLVQGTGKTKVDNLLKIMDKGCVKLSGSDMAKGMVSLPKALGLSDTGVAPKAPVFSHKSGTSFTALSQKITITAEAGCTIYYSTDGKPITYKNGVLSSNASRYSSTGITITNTAKRTIYALCIKESNKLASKCVSATYTMKTPVSSITIFTNNGLNTLLLGGSLKLNTNVYPAGAANKKVTWSITPANQGVKIDSSGKVSATSTATAGTYTVKATSVSNPEVTQTFRVAVYPKEYGAASYTLKTKSYTMWNGETVAYPQVDVKYNDGSTASSVQTGLTWISSNSSIVYVDTTNKRFQAKGAGKATLTGYDPKGSGKSVKVTITVSEPIKGITLPATATLQTGKSIALSPVFNPSNAKKQPITYSISPANQGVTVSSSGKVTASKTAKTGTYTVTVSATQPYSAGSVKTVTAKVTISVFSIAEKPNLAVSDTKVELFKGKNLSSTALTKTINVTTNCKWTYEVSPANIVSVAKSTTSLVVTARGTTTGTAKITVKTTDGTNLKKTITVNVHNAPSEIRISTPTGRGETICYGKTLKLSAVLGTVNGPLDSYGKKITWTSSNPKVLPVNSSGVVTSKGYDAQTATITAKTADGKTATFTVIAVDKITSLRLVNGSTLGQSDGQFVWIMYADTQHGGNYSTMIEAQSSDPVNCPAQVGSFNNKRAILAHEKVNKDGSYRNGTYTITLKTTDGSGFSASVKVKFIKGNVYILK
ncbi:MAG: S8 family serine peptidase [Lachnospiraceae bacterium]|nr:S8 family serine peptidase [Lachnospiraceae bacterium]